VRGLGLKTRSQRMLEYAQRRAQMFGGEIMGEDESHLGKRKRTSGRERSPTPPPIPEKLEESWRARKRRRGVANAAVLDAVAEEEEEIDGMGIVWAGVAGESSPRSVYQLI
jgi:hypothetical protein